jgi:hypothetical protein
VWTLLFVVLDRVFGDAIQIVCTAADVLTVVYETGDWDDL